MPKFTNYIILGISACLPIISIFGARYSGLTGNSDLLELMVALIVVLVLAIVWKKPPAQTIVPIVIYFVSLSLLLHVTFVTMYPYGSDVNLETFVFQATKNNLYWNNSLSSDLLTQTYNSMLSVTILPTFFSTFAGINYTLIYKLIFPIVLAFTPLVLYQVYKNQFGNKVAFLSVFFFISSYIFYNEIVSIAKQMIAELFLAILLMLILKKEKKFASWKILFVLSSFGLVVSHYGTAYLFLGFLFSAWLYSRFFGKKEFRIPIKYVLLFTIICFSWYTLTSNPAPFIQFWRLDNHIINSFVTNFTNLGARQTDVLKGFGLLPQTLTIIQQVGRDFSYLTELLVIIGTIGTFLVSRRFKISPEYLGMALAALGLILASLIVPYFATTLNISRIYQISLFILAPFCILGSDLLFKSFNLLWTRNFSYKRKGVMKKTKIQESFLGHKLKRVFIVLVLIIFFLYNVGFVSQITGDVPTSKSLSFGRMNKSDLYAQAIIPEMDASGAQWLKLERNYNSIVYGDRISIRNVLSSIGEIPQEQVQLLDNTTNLIVGNSYIFLRTFNVVGGSMLEPNYPSGEYYWNITEITSLNYSNKIYSNGECDVYNTLP
jgi:uncharacterized membrane protein